VIDSTALWVTLGIFASLVAAGLGFPIPEEIPIVTAGVLAGHAAEQPALDPGLVGVVAADPSATFPCQIPWGQLAWASSYAPPLRSPLRWWFLLPVCILGVVISDALLYGAGRFWGLSVLKFPWMRRLVPLERFERIQHNFQHYGILILLFARLLPGIRSPIFLTAGIMRLPLRRFLLGDLIYAIPGVSLLFSLAFWFTDSFLHLVYRVKDEVDKVRPILIIFIVAVVAVYLVFHVLRRPVPTGDPQELPLIGGQVAAQIDSGERKETPSRHGAEPTTPSSESAMQPSEHRSAP
jgi:membrane protein DedA with SNARE-associated domain